MSRADSKKDEKFVHISARDYVKQYVGDTAPAKAERVIPSPDPRANELQTSESDLKDFIELKKNAQRIDEPTERPTPAPVVESTPVEKLAPVVESVPVAEPVSLSYRVIGEAFNSYIIVEKGDKMLLIDKHAAHERIIFEKLKAAMHAQKSAISQMLMFPIEIMMTSDEIQSIKEYKAEIEKMGFEFTAGKYTVNVTAIPDGIRTEAVNEMFEVMADRIKNNTGSAKLTRDLIFEKALYQASCKAAIKAGREYADEHRDYIVAKLMEIPDITVCPHGRPVAMELSKRNLDTQFERG